MHAPGRTPALSVRRHRRPHAERQPVSFPVNISGAGSLMRVRDRSVAALGPSRKDPRSSARRPPHSALRKLRNCGKPATARVSGRFRLRNALRTLRNAGPCTVRVRARRYGHRARGLLLARWHRSTRREVGPATPPPGARSVRFDAVQTPAYSPRRLPRGTGRRGNRLPCLPRINRPRRRGSTSGPGTPCTCPHQAARHCTRSPGGCLRCASARGPAAAAARPVR